MEELTVIGSGTMGHSITLCAACAGISVSMNGVTESDADAALDMIRKKLSGLIANELIHPAEVTKILDKIRLTTSMDEASKDASFIIECNKI